jgi:hypothetical protein
MRAKHSVSAPTTTALSRALWGLAALLAAWAGTGCTLIDSRGERFRGTELSDIKNPLYLDMVDGRLIVANGRTWSGVAVVDTATEAILDYYPVDNEVTLAVGAHDGRVLVGESFSAMHLLNVRSRSFHEFHVSSQYSYGPVIINSQGRTFFFGSAANYTNDGQIWEFKAGDAAAPIAGLAGLPFPSGLAVAQGKLFLSNMPSNKIRTIDLANGGMDSVNLPLLLGDSTLRPIRMAAEGDKVYIELYRANESLRIAVLNVATGLVEKVIPVGLVFHLYGMEPRPPRVVNGVWYRMGLPGWNSTGSNGYRYDSVGVEAVNLVTGDVDMIVEPGALGGVILDFVPGSPGQGYVIVGDDKHRIRVRKIAY